MSDVAPLLLCIEKLEKGRVLCIGDVMLDRFVYGNVERISPEAPIPVFQKLSEAVMLGGAGNVARNIAGLGGKTHFISVVGNDQAGRDLTTQIGNLENLDARLITDASRKTSIKTRYIASGQQMMRADDETISPIDENIRKMVLDAAVLGLEDFSALVLADYGKGVLSAGIAGELIQIARLKGIPVIVDPQGSNYDNYMGATLVTPNRKELADAIGLPADSTEEVVSAAAQIARQSGIDAVLATRSHDGMTLVRNAHNYKHFQTKAKEVFDVSGAGDTVVACIATAVSAGISIEDAVALANAAAGIVVGKVGTAVAYVEDLTASLQEQERATGEAKILNLASALDCASVWRNRGLKLGFTNGCFDLLHPGHLAVLSQAKAACDKLIVGLNSDASTKRLKGDERPIQTESARAAVLASLEIVDLVVIFKEDTPATLVEALRPEVFVKGSDYSLEQIPEAKVVQGYGGEIVLAKLAHGHSTSATIARIVD